MTKRHWMPLFISDYLADTAHLTAVESGAYLHLIMHYWQHGGLPNDVDKLRNIAKISSHRWKKICPVLRKFFHHGWRHKRIDRELERAENISQKRSGAAKKRHRKKSANAMQMHTHARAYYSHITDSSSLLGGAIVDNAPRCPQSAPEQQQQQTTSDAFSGSDLEPLPMNAEERADLLASLDRIRSAREIKQAEADRTRRLEQNGRDATRMRKRRAAQGGQAIEEDGNEHRD